ncbi:MAG: hypothetical protein EOO77_08970 [Oxalobacteraceae bacterium]|nr:MAG: hypothetical protein EOO77_08970 [Oxalobacteraceae bacterium]
MIDDTILSRLQSYHDDIVARIAASVAVIEADNLSSLSTLSARRWQMVRLLREYQIFKHSRIFDPAISSGSPSAVAAAREMKINCIAIGNAFSSYVKIWSSGLITTRWEDYRIAMIEMSTLLTRHVKSERRSIVALLSLPNTNPRRYSGL